MTYGCQTWSLSDTKLEALCISQRKMEREFLGITLLDKKPYTWIHTKTKFATLKLLSKKTYTGGRDIWQDFWVTAGHSE